MPRIKSFRWQILALVLLGFVATGSAIGQEPAPAPEANSTATPAAEGPEDPCPGCDKTHGKCVEKKCVCSKGFEGPNCNVLSPCHDARAPQLGPCSGHGLCQEGACKCDDIYRGTYCEHSKVNIAACPNNCTYSGYCVQPLKEGAKPECVCSYGAKGDDCSESLLVGGQCSATCLAHGNCKQDYTDARKIWCECNPGWTGKECDQQKCPKCLNGGTCQNNVCACVGNYTGVDCADLKCPNDCGGKGHCDTKTGQCVCVKGFGGAGCQSDLSTCPNNCTSGERVKECAGGACVCKLPFGGADCSKDCPLACSGNGNCIHGVCHCDDKHAGEACAHERCPNDCSGKGTCAKVPGSEPVQMKCFCEPLRGGADCSQILCPEQCGGKGMCSTGKCICEGPNRAKKLAQQEYKHPALHTNASNTSVPFVRLEHIFGAELSKELIIETDLNYGMGFTGLACESRVCMTDCGRGALKGVCDMTSGLCKCNSGFEGYMGLDCDYKKCASNCTGHGRCLDDKCLCELGDKDHRLGWYGDQCQLEYCPNNCSEAKKLGSCVKGECQCAPRFWGPDCSKPKCPEPPNSVFDDDDHSDPNFQHGCGLNGFCNREGECACKPGWSGDDCDRKSCLNDCSAAGKCNMNGTCTCDKGRRGLDCSRKSGDPCPHDCFSFLKHGVCNDAECMCQNGWHGDDCGLKHCTPDDTCSGRGTCNTTLGTCNCEEGWGGEGCKEMWCIPADCSGHGKCIHDDKGSPRCNCTAPYTGVDCKSMGCFNNCNGHGTCVDGKCMCDPMYKGENCEVQKCPDGCSDHGICVLAGEHHKIATAGLSSVFPNGQPPADFEGCVCHKGWSGLSCAVGDCSCEGHGKCVARGDLPKETRHLPFHAHLPMMQPTCLCEGDYAGPTCAHKKCDKDCSGHGQCINGGCICDMGYYGSTCVTPICPKECSNHGLCQFKDPLLIPKSEDPLKPFSLEDMKAKLGCECDAGWMNADCAEPVKCPSDCSDHGVCLKTGKCQCDKKWTGEGCEKELCPRDCSNHGECTANGCKCLEGFEKEDCSAGICKPSRNCTGNGVCITERDNAVCQCNPGYGSVDCSKKRCEKDCGHGECLDDKCECFPGWKGDDCKVDACPNKCSGNGECDGIKCKCKPGWLGDACDKESPCGHICAPGGGGHGTCLSSGECACEGDWVGKDCTLPKYPCGKACPRDGTGHGACVEGKCQCYPGYKGEGCVESLCEADCNKKGVCHLDIDGRPTCVCQPPYTGVLCQDEVCFMKCVHGHCLNNKCVCHPDWTGDLCEKELCPNDCSKQGSCTLNGCDCFTGWWGPDCSTEFCDHNCTGNGLCMGHHCECFNGYRGEICDEVVCPQDCNGNGYCNRKDLPNYRPFLEEGCVCRRGFEGESCLEETTCGKTCSPLGDAHGVCSSGACVCDKGWNGTNCLEPICPDDCNGNGACDLDADMPGCKCRPPYIGSDCAELNPCGEVCHPAGPAHGKCLQDGTCKCEEGWAGKDCTVQIHPCGKDCPLDGTGNGWCQPDGKCICHPGYYGSSCLQSQCLSNENGVCGGNGVCQLIEEPEKPAIPGVVDPKDKNMTQVWGCVCSSPFAGPLCQRHECAVQACSPHGKCMDEQCFCESGWFGPQCNRTGECDPTDCNGRGRCTNDEAHEPYCKCNEPFAGPTCLDTKCGHDCHGRGVCLNFGCRCDEGYSGGFCEIKGECNATCFEHGYCVADEKGGPECACKAGYWGPLCEEEICEDPCSGHGVCVRNKQGVERCECDKQFAGHKCELDNKCFYSDCHGNGKCVEDKHGGHCECNDPYIGSNCTREYCPGHCSYHGKCNADKMCECDEKWFGYGCDLREDCPYGCEHGYCLNEGGEARCDCKAGYGGKDCSKKLCYNIDCGEHGKCMDNTCVCEPGWKKDPNGTKCDVKGVCPPSLCNGHGDCMFEDEGEAKCECWHPYAGEHCEQVGCAHKCSGNGQCLDFACVCNLGFGGHICEEDVCPNECNGRGQCVKGVFQHGDRIDQSGCECTQPWGSLGCEKEICPTPCNNDGTCIDQTCHCSPPYHGELCELISCPNDCTADSAGHCDDTTGSCSCNPGYEGADCATFSEAKCELHCQTICEPARDGIVDEIKGIGESLNYQDCFGICGSKLCHLPGYEETLELAEGQETPPPPPEPEDELEGTEPAEHPPPELEGEGEVPEEGTPPPPEPEGEGEVPEEGTPPPPPPPEQ